MDEAKDDPLDFALWKFAKPDEPKWPSPWGDGRPGWHIECSAMSRALLDPQGVGFDIHGGGADLIFPHHENEIAQSEPLMRQPPMADVWMHGGLLLFDNQKMSKSLGNFEPLSDLLDRYDPQAVRLLFLQTGYRKVMNFTDDAVAGANVALDRLKKTYRALDDRGNGSNAREGALMKRIEAALDDDMNTAVALSELLAYRQGSTQEFAYALGVLGLKPADAWLQETVREFPADFTARLRSALGRNVADGETPQALLESVIALRARARAEKDWSTSDELRDALAQCGIALKDAKDGTTWSIVQ